MFASPLHIPEPDRTHPVSLSTISQHSYQAAPFTGTENHQEQIVTVLPPNPEPEHRFHKATLKMDEFICCQLIVEKVKFWVARTSCN